MTVIFKVLYRFYRLFSRSRYWIRRRLTPAGWLVLIALTAAAATGVDTENTVAYQALAPLLFLLLSSMCFAWTFRARFSARRTLPRFGTVGQSLSYIIAVRNLGRKTESDLSLLENLADPRPSFAEWHAVQRADERRIRSFRFDKRWRPNPFKRVVVKDAAVPPAQSNEEVEVGAELTPLRRGMIRFEGLTLARPDPFGLFRAFCSFPLPQVLLVLPKRYTLPPVALPGTMKYQDGGVALASNVGLSDEFVSLRDYRRGDPLRHIHWRSWAKTAKPIVKEFEDEFFVRHALVLDTFIGDPRSEAFEEAVSIAASFACTVSIQESLLDLLFVGTEAFCFTAGRGLAQSDHILEILATVSSCGEKPFNTLENLVLEHAAVVSGCICVLLAWDDKRRDFIRKLESLGVPLLVLVVTERGQSKLMESSTSHRPEQFYVLEAGQIEEGLAKAQMKTPPLLIGAVLMFWGWQTGFFVVGAVMALVLEGARLTKARWEFSDDDFSRIWTICTLLFLGAALYAFTDNGGPARYGSFFQDPSPATQTSAGAATSRTASAILRWLPMVLFLFVCAQAYSAREEIPLSTISLILRKRWKRAVRLGRPLPAQRGMNVSYPYFAICLFAASVHPGENNFYFWGLCLLLAWALWSQRTRRFGFLVWASTLSLAFTFGYFGQHGLGRLQGYLQNIDAQWLERFSKRRGVDPSLSRTQIGHIGRLKNSGKIIIRLEPQEGSMAPEYLREASYRIFGGNMWRAGASRENFQAVQQETNSSAFMLVPGKTNFTTVNITCYLDGYSRESQSPIGLLPLPTGAGRLENLPVFVLKANNLGAVLAEGPGLLNFDAAYGPGTTLDSPFNPAESISFTNRGGWLRRQSDSRTNQFPSEANPDLFIPPDEALTLDQIVADWKVPQGNRSLATRAITGFFQSNFTYSTWQELPNLRTNQTPLGFFLLRTHSGHCEVLRQRDCVAVP